MLHYMGVGAGKRAGRTIICKRAFACTLDRPVELSRKLSRPLIVSPRKSKLSE